MAVLIQNEELTVSWLGDSQAILVRKGHVVTLMDPHKPDREVGSSNKHACTHTHALFDAALILDVFCTKIGDSQDRKKEYR